jgi:hypothetical protein
MRKLIIFLLIFTATLFAREYSTFGISFGKGQSFYNFSYDGDTPDFESEKYDTQHFAIKYGVDIKRRLQVDYVLNVFSAEYLDPSGINNVGVQGEDKNKMGSLGIDLTWRVLETVLTPTLIAGLELTSNQFNTWENIESASGHGANAGIGFSMKLGKHAYLTADYRWRFHGDYIFEQTSKRCVGNYCSETTENFYYTDTIQMLSFGLVIRLKSL